MQNNKTILTKRPFRSFSLIANMVIWLVLTILLLLQFNAFYEANFANYVNNADFRAELLVRSVRNPATMQQSKNINMVEDLRSKLTYEFSFFDASDNRTVSAKVLVFNDNNAKWEEIYRSQNGSTSEITQFEKKISVFLVRILDIQDIIKYNGKGFSIDGESYFKIGNTSLKAVASLDANQFIIQQTRVAAMLLMILAVLGAVLFLRYRIFMVGIRRAFLGDDLDEEEAFLNHYETAVSSLHQADPQVALEMSDLPENEGNVFDVYRDVVFAASQGKILLVREEELRGYTVCGEHLLSMFLQNPGDVPVARDVSRRFIANLFPHYQAVKKALVSVSEAATNVIKHGGQGTFEIKRIDETTLRFIFSDQGPGMVLKHLPSMIFFKGFSTSKSLGYGFTLISSIVDKIILSTNKKGTTICFDIEFKR